MTDRGPDRGTAEFGPYFCLEPASEQHRPWSGLFTREAWRVPMEQARGVIAADAVQDRVVASIVFLGLAARVLSPALAVTVLGRPATDTLDLSWRIDTGRVLLAGPEPSLGAAFAGLDDLGRWVADEFRLSPRVLAGNSASALVGAAKVMSSARAGLTRAVSAIVAEAFDSFGLAGSLTTGPAGPVLRRDSCCLFYRVPGAGYCGDCVLAGYIGRLTGRRTDPAAVISSASGSSNHWSSVPR